MRKDLVGLAVFGSLFAVVVLFVACFEEEKPKPAPPSSATKSASTAPAAPRRPLGPAAAIAHAGVGTPPKMSDGCRAAVDAALQVLEQNGDPIEAAAAGVAIMEDDPRFNAGTGSRVRIDGETVQMDAAVMDSSGKFGAVAAIEDVRHPIEVARAVTKTPHLLLVGDGATRFARSLGMKPHDPGTDEGKKKAKELQGKLLTNDPSLPEAWRSFDWRSRWNFARSINDAGLAGGGPVDAGSDTVGVAVRAADGRFAVALSTGGTSVTLRGRVGDVPILGAGLYAGKYGAAAATGTGERIIEMGLARRVHEWLVMGLLAEDAAKRAAHELRGKDIGIVVIDADSMGAAADRDMAWAGRELGSLNWSGPSPEP